MVSMQASETKMEKGNSFKFIKKIVTTFIAVLLMALKY